MNKTITQFLEQLKKTRTLNTWTTAKYHMKAFLAACEKRDLDPTVLSKKQLQKIFLDDWIPHLSPNSIRGRTVILSIYYEFLGKKAGDNPAQGLKIPKIPKTLPKPIPDETLEIFMKNLPGKWEFFFETLLNTGLRVQEAFDLKIPDFDIEGEFLHVKGKGQKERLIPVGTSLSSLFQTYLAKHRPKSDNPWLFLNQIGNQLQYSSMRSLLIRLQRGIGVSKFTLHQFRHTYATIHVRRGTDIRVLRDLLGHESIMTTEIYTKVTLKTMRRAQETGTILGERDKLTEELLEKDRTILKLKRALKHNIKGMEDAMELVESLEQG